MCKREEKFSNRLSEFQAELLVFPANLFSFRSEVNKNSKCQINFAQTRKRKT